MPFQKQVSDEEILEQFERDDLGRKGFTYAEIAEGITSVKTAEAIRQRLVQMDGDKVASVEVGGVRLWHLPDEQVWHRAANLGLVFQSWVIAVAILIGIIIYEYEVMGSSPSFLNTVNWLALAVSVVLTVAIMGAAWVIVKRFELGSAARRWWQGVEP